MVESGSPLPARASAAHSASNLLVPGCSGCAFAITGQPVATAAAKSPPETPLKANGKLFGPKTTTGPTGAKCDRIFALLSITGQVHDPSRAAVAAWRSCVAVRGISTSLKRGAIGSPVSR